MEILVPLGWANFQGCLTEPSQLRTVPRAETQGTPKSCSILATLGQADRYKSSAIAYSVSASGCQTHPSIDMAASIVHSFPSVMSKR